MRLLITLATIVVGLAGSSAEGATRLEWDANTESDLAGYRLSYGTSSGIYTGTIDVGKVTTFDFIEPDVTVRYYLALQAYDTDGNFSGYSNEVVTSPVPTALRLTGLSANRTSPQPIGTAITFSATATGGTPPYQFKFFVVNGSTTTVARNWATSASFVWTPTAAGSSYAIRAWARNAGSTEDAPANTNSILQMSYAITASSNQPPSVNAGNDTTVTLPSSTTLNGTASDDGLPMPPGTLTLTWSKVSGPGTVSFGSPNSGATTASFSAAGTYVLRLTASDGTLSRTDDVTVVVNPASGGGGGTGTGLKGEYFNDPGTGATFTTLAATRTDATVNFDWGSGVPAPGVQDNHFSVRWSGQIQAAESGTYTFATISDDGVRLWVNNQLVINDWTNHAAARNGSAPITLTAGTRYTIRLEYFDALGRGTVQLLWTRPGQSETVIPTTYLFPPSTAANQAPVVNAGSDGSVTLPGAVTLSGTVTDDGQPSPPGVVTVSWSRASGPGTVTFSAPAAAATTASFSAAGTYVLRLTASDGALSASDDVTVVVNAASGGGGGTGTGLKGEYFNDPGTGATFTTLAVTRTDAMVNFTWGGGAPASGLQNNHFSVRWTGQVQAPVTGSYRFTTVSDDAVRLWVNGQLVIDNWTRHTATTDTSPLVALTAGQRYTIRLDYYERTGPALIQLRWTPPGQALATIPTDRLYPQ